MIGTLIRDARRAAGISAADLADAANVAVGCIYKIERHHHLPGSDVLRDVCRCLQLSADDLLGLTPIRKIAPGSTISAPLSS